MFETYTPQQLRDAIEIELQKTDDVKLASLMAMAKLKKNSKCYENMSKAKGIKMDIKKKIIEFLRKNPKPEDKKQFHKFAESIGKDPDNVEEVAYSILGDIVSGGKSKGKDVKVDPRELSMGIKIEMEHVSNKDIAEKIARDHLVEIPDYYTRLKKMESEAMSKADNKVKKVMHEFKQGALRSGSGEKVTDRKQAIAIAMSESGKSKKMKINEDEENNEKKEKKMTKSLIKIYDNVYIDLSKAKQHKYVKRVPKPGGGYKYFYKQDKKEVGKTEVSIKEKKDALINAGYTESLVNSMPDDVINRAYDKQQLHKKPIGEPNRDETRQKKINEQKEGGIGSFHDPKTLTDSQIESYINEAVKLPIKQYKKISQSNWEPVDHSEKKRGEKPSGGKKNISTHSELHEQFMDYIAELPKEKRRLFMGGKMDFQNRKFISPRSDMALKWSDGKISMVRMEKARVTKYIRKFKGKDGKWKYIYKDDSQNKKKQEKNEKKAKPEKITNDVSSIINLPGDTLIELEISHFSSDKIDEFSPEIGYGAIYFLQRPDTISPGDSFDVNDRIEEMEQEERGDMTDEEYSEYTSDEFYESPEERIQSEGWYYGNYVNTTSLKTTPNKLLDMRSLSGFESKEKKDFDSIKWLQQNVEDFKNKDDEYVEEFLDDFYGKRSNVNDSFIEENINRRARELGYDAVLYSDQSEGNPYTSIAVVNEDAITANQKSKKMEKAKYIRRTGTPGNYKYFYKEKKKKDKSPVMSSDKIKDIAGNEVWKVKLGEETYRVNKTDQGWRVSGGEIGAVQEGNTPISFRGLKFANTPEEAVKDHIKGIEEHKKKKSDKTPVMSTNKIKWENEKNIANKKVIEAPIPTNKYPNAYVSIVEEGSDNILAYSRTEKKYLSTGNFLGRFKSINEAKNKIQEEYEKLKAKDDKTSIMSSGDNLKKAIEKSGYTLSKAKKVPVGTVSGQYKKVAEGKWQKVTDTKDSGKKEQTKPGEKKKETTTAESSDKKETIKNALKKIATIFADALSGKDVNQPTGQAVEETGESLKNKKKVETKKKEDKKDQKNV